MRGQELLAGLNRQLADRWREAIAPHWLYKYNPFIAEITDMHRERILLEMPENEVTYMLCGLLGRQHSETPVATRAVSIDCVNLLRAHSSVTWRRADDVACPPSQLVKCGTRDELDAAVDRFCARHKYAFPSNVSEMLIPIMENPWLRPRHMRQLYCADPEAPYTISQPEITYLFTNLFSDHREARAQLDAAAHTFHASLNDGFNVMSALLVSPNLARIVLGYALGTREPQPLRYEPLVFDGWRGRCVAAGLAGVGGYQN